MGVSDERGAGRRLRRITALVVVLNFGYFWVEVAVALAIGSVALLADSVDFLEDTAVNLLILIAFGWPLRRRAVLGRILALIILAPAVAAIWTAVAKFADPTPPDPLSLVFTSGGAIVVNGVCALLLASLRNRGGSLSKAAFLAARNDVFANAAMILMGLVTAATRSGWPDIVLGLFIVALNATAAREVWRAAGEERLAAQALDRTSH
ncbi:cation transporter [Pseudoclavibacter caeni]|jgi:Co/Zn/Cd efflux system component|uniref:Cation transporter n=1 Tax=Pseudoclavibacter caeni TaxID=908846 RepID=A0A7C8BV02_9MICO|nr:cation transporter [Pseudoclavibacter caeni]KAB1633382.1 cation transporter [Pseudoclavibacter caeni]NYJ96638.1 Co/Zn/Cd efflux system component [Pseudoclavibacter caeni]